MFVTVLGVGWKQKKKKKTNKQKTNQVDHFRDSLGPRTQRTTSSLRPEGGVGEGGVKTREELLDSA